VEDKARTVLHLGGGTTLSKGEYRLGFRVVLEHSAMKMKKKQLGTIQYWQISGLYISHALFFSICFEYVCCLVYTPARTNQKFTEMSFMSFTE